MRVSLAAFLFALFLLSCGGEKTKIPEGRISGMYNRAMLLRYEKYDSVGYFAAEMDSLAAEASAEELAMSDITNAVWLRSKPRYRQAMQRYRHALKMLENSNADTLKGQAECGLGFCYRQTGQMDSAFFYFFKGLHTYEKSRNEEGQAGTLASIGETYQQMGQLDTAYKYAQQSIRLCQNNTGSFTYLIALHSLANIYGEKGMIDSALALDQSGIHISDSIRKPFLKSTFYDNKGLCFREKGLTDSSYFYFRQCIAIDSATGNLKQMGDSYLNLASLAMFEKENPKAIQFLNRSLELSRKAEYIPGMTGAWEYLSSIYQEAGDNEKALAFKDSVFYNYKKNNKKERMAMILELEAVYNSEKKEEQIASQQAELKQQKLITTGTILISVLLLLLGVSYYRRLRQKKTDELQAEIRKQEELATIAVFEKEQNERMRIARDMHDSLGQMLAVTKMQITSIPNADTKPAADLIDKTIRELRSITHNLIPEELNFGLVKAISEICEQISSGGKTKAEFTAEANLHSFHFSDSLSISVYRIVQEITGNMLRHAEAGLIRISLDMRENVFICTISDNGKGMDTLQFSESDGIGWRNVQARVRLLNGSMQVESEKGKGTSVEIKIPQ